MNSKKKLHVLVNVLALIFPLLVFGQTVPKRETNTNKFHEEKGDNYLPNAYNNKRTSAPYKIKKKNAYRLTGSSIFTYQVNVDSAGQNILGDAANEPNIAINPLNNNEIVIGWRQFDNVSSNFRQAGWGYSTDAGQTWYFPGKIESGVFRSDPVLDYDAAGNIYYNSLTIDSLGNYPCKVFRSSTGGAVWDAGVDAGGGDKQWMAIDRTGGIGNGNIYSFWTSYYSSCYPGNFTRSSTGGNSYESCIEVDGDPSLGTMAIGNDGEVFIAGDGFSDIVVSKSENAKTPGSLIAWDFPSYAQLDGSLTFQPVVNPAGLLGQTNIDVDRSNGPGRGNVYVFAAVERLSVFDYGDVMFAKSTDGGMTWLPPVRVNDDSSTTNMQWFGTMSVAPNGRIDCVWLDTRDGQGTDLSALYYSYSTDQGDSWSANEKLSDSFDPHIGYPDQDKMGDYFDMISLDDGAHLAWANTLNGEEDVYYSFIEPPVVLGTKDEPDLNSILISPNPSRGKFILHMNGEPDRIEIYTLLGEQIFSSSVTKTKQEIDISSFSRGIYFLHAYQKNGKPKVAKLVVE